MSSVEGLQIETHQFRDVDYVLIRVDIGKMPPGAAKAYITKLRSETALCKELDDLGIRYDLVGVRDTGGSGVKVEAKSEGPKDIGVAVPKRALRGSHVETLPEGHEDLTHFRQQFLNSLAIANKKKMIEETAKQTIVANRNEVLKTNNLSEDLKQDSFADAMKLLDDQ